MSFGSEPVDSAASCLAELRMLQMALLKAGLEIAYLNQLSFTSVVRCWLWRAFRRFKRMASSTRTCVTIKGHCW